MDDEISKSTQLQGGVVMAYPPEGGKGDNEQNMATDDKSPGISGESPQSYEPETVVVPPVADPSANAFIPNIPKTVGSGGTSFGGAQTPFSSVSLWKRRILSLAILFIIAVALFFGGRFVVGYIARSREVTISYWGLWENEAVIRGILNDFEAKNPKIKVQYAKQSHKQYRERLQAAINRGDGPDVFRFHNTWVAMLKNELSPVPKDIMSPETFSSTFYPTATNDLVAGGTIYGIPLMIDGLGLYYNEDIFASAGVSPPTTWVELLNIVPKLTAKEESTIVTSAIALGTVGNVEHFSDILALMFLQNGANLVAPTGTQAEETLIFYHNFADPTNPYYTWNETLDNSIYAFAIGRVAMILAPSWRAFDIQVMNPSLHFRVAPVPQLPGNNVTWASYWVEGVSAKSKHQEAAWKLMSYLSERDVASKLYTEASKTRLFGEPYARVDLGNQLTADPIVGAYIAQASSARSFPLASRTFDNGINDKMNKYLEDAVNSVSGGVAPSAALQTMNAGFRQVLSTYGLTSGAAPGTQ